MIIMQSNSFKIKETVQLINEALFFEEKGFAPNLEEHANNIIKLICQNLEKTLSLGSNTNYKYSVVYDLNGQNVTITGEINCVKGNNIKPSKNAEFHPQNNTIEINIENLAVANIQNWLENNTFFKSSLMHELKHLYQYIKLRSNVNNTNKPNIIPFKNRQIYKNNLSVLSSSTNITAKQIAYLIYYTFPTEITAIQEALYIEIKNKCKHSFELLNLLFESNLSMVSADINKMLDDLSNLTDKAKESLTAFLKKNYNRDIPWFINRLTKGKKLIDRALKRIEKKIRFELGMNEGAFIDIDYLLNNK